MCKLRITKIFSLLMLVQSQVVLCGNTVELESQSEETALEKSRRTEQQKALFEQQISILETENGPYNGQQLEYLRGITNVLIEEGSLSEADRILDRQLQLIRIQEGPFSQSQIPVVSELIANDIRRQDWQSVSDHFNYIRFIHTHNPDTNSAVLLDALNDIRNWHLSMLVLDDFDRYPQPIEAFRDVLPDIIEVAELVFAAETRELISWLYSIAVDNYRMGAEWLGLRLVRHIEEIAGTMDDLEIQAMTTLYVADFEMLRQRVITNRAKRESASKASSQVRGGDSSYRIAMDMLLKAGIEQSQVDALFERPAVLPLPQFHFSLDQMLAAQTASGYTVLSSHADDEVRNSRIHLGDFSAWGRTKTRRPPVPQFASNIDTESNDENHSVQVRFNINSIGYSDNIRAEAAQPDSSETKAIARGAVKTMQFRPVFTNGRWRRIRDVTLRYIYQPANFR